MDMFGLYYLQFLDYTPIALFNQFFNAYIVDTIFINRGYLDGFLINGIEVINNLHNNSSFDILDNVRGQDVQCFSHYILNTTMNYFPFFASEIESKTRNILLKSNLTGNCDFTNESCDGSGCFLYYMISIFFCFNMLMGNFWTFLIRLYCVIPFLLFYYVGCIFDIQINETDRIFCIFIGLTFHYWRLKFYKNHTTDIKQNIGDYGVDIKLCQGISIKPKKLLIFAGLYLAIVLLIIYLFLYNEKDKVLMANTVSMFITDQIKVYATVKLLFVDIANDKNEINENDKKDK